MSENKSGPVKPPVLDLSARESAAKPEAGTSAKTAASDSGPGGEKPAGKAADTAGPREKSGDGAKTPPPSAPPTAEASNGGGIALAIVGGGILGLAAAYGLAWAGFWPAAPADPQLAELTRNLPQLRQVISGVPGMQTTLAQTSAELDTLDTRIGALERTASAQPAPAGGSSVDLTGIESDIAALTERLDAFGSPADGADPQALATLRGALDTLATQVATLETRLGAQESQLDGIGETLATTQANLAGQPRNLTAAVRLPLVLSALETAFAGARPYSAELDALRRGAPDVEVPDTLIAAAGTGLPRGDAVTAAFNAVLPAMLAGRPSDPDADWQETTLDWFRSALALRPTGNVEGDSPDAMAARLEAALARQDFLAADEILTELPEPMRQAAGAVPGMVALHADAARLLETVRRHALTLSVESAP